MHGLLYRKQFIFSNKEVTGFDLFSKSTIMADTVCWHLYHHPDLPVCKGLNDHCELIMLGYILDPARPDLDDQALINELTSLKSFDALLKLIGNYAGRYAIIHKDKAGIRIVNDAVGFREVYYHKTDDQIACGSTPDILATAFNLSVTKDPARLAFFSSPKYKESDYVWLGFRTLYDSILHLPSNHYLDLDSLRVVRFWPKEVISRIPLEKVAVECAAILRGTLEAALNRYKLHMGITSGWDTRLLLSTARDFKDRIFFYINKPRSFTEDNRDLRIARELSHALDLDLHVIDIPDEVENEFRNVFYKNNILAREKLIQVYHEVYKRNWQDTHTVSGAMGNGLARIYMHYPEGVPVTGKNMAIFAGYQNYEYPVGALQEWIDEVNPLCKNLNISLMDLYQWEQENAHWAARTASEQDIVREEITPFNNRRLIELFWSLEPKYRYQYNPEIYKRIISISWKEALNFPFNPGIRSFLYKLCRLGGFEQTMYYYYKRRKFLSAIKLVTCFIEFEVMHITNFFSVDFTPIC
jgi:hypothetical protein